jgi:hypothetical protein
VGVLGGMIVVYAALEASMVFALRVRTRSMLLLCSCSLTGVRFLIAVV